HSPVLSRMFISGGFYVSLQRLGASLLFIGVGVAGNNWKAIWLEPRTAVVLTLGETKPYTVIGLTALETKADLTKYQNLKITSSDPTVLEVHRDKALLIGKKPGHVDIRISISGVAETVPAFVREPKTTVRNTIDGVWKALFTGDFGERPKMVSEILFAVNAN